MNTKKTLLPILTLLIFTLFLGCLNSTLLSPLNGTWETKVIGFTQTIQFESNGTGVLVTTLGQKSFEYQVLDSATLRVRYTGDTDWDEKEYTLINNNTLELDGLTWVRKGSV